MKKENNTYLPFCKPSFKESPQLTGRAVGSMWPLWSYIFLAVELKAELDKNRGGDSITGLIYGAGD